MALEELYGWYRETEDMMGKTLRDAPLVPLLDSLLTERWWRDLDSVVDTLMEGRGVPAGRRRPRRSGWPWTSPAGGLSPQTA